MVHSCCAHGCKNKQGESGRSFYRFPANPEHRKKWVAAVSREGWQPTSASRLCSAHFAKGKRDSNPLSPDFVPSIFKHTPSQERQRSFRAMETFERRQLMRRKLRGAAFNQTAATAPAENVEKATRGQATSTNAVNPAPSLVKAVCYPEASKFRSEATVWGCTHEEEAASQYTAYMKKDHEEFQLRKCGLFINPSYPYLGATPDGVTSCKCCGTGILEVKCPFCVKDDTLDVAASTKSFCLERVNGCFDLKKDDSYYYQLQAQLHICDKPHCDLVVWTTKNVFIRRYFRNTPFSENERLKVENFFKVGVLPELLGKWITHNNCKTFSPPSASVCCYCETREEGTMVLCGNSHCKIKKFHLKCLGLKRLPKHGWWCIDCRKADLIENFASTELP